MPASQAGRRRFEPGRPLSKGVCPSSPRGRRPVFWPGQGTRWPQKLSARPRGATKIAKITSALPKHSDAATGRMASALCALVAMTGGRRLRRRTCLTVHQRSNENPVEKNKPIAETRGATRRKSLELETLCNGKRATTPATHDHEFPSPYETLGTCCTGTPCRAKAGKSSRRVSRKQTRATKRARRSTGVRTHPLAPPCPLAARAKPAAARFAAPGSRAAAPRPWALRA